MSDGIGLNTIDLNNINLDDDNFDKDGPSNIILVRLHTWCIRFKQCKACEKKINKYLMSIVWHPTRLQDWCMTKDENL